MASQIPLPVPEIYTVPSSSPRPTAQVGRCPSPEASYFSLRPHAQPRSSPGDFPGGSPAPIQRSDTGSSSRLTPPAPESQSRQDSSYFSTPRRSQSRQTRATSPSEHLPNPTFFSPGVSSSGSFHSSDFGHSTCSYSSGASGASELLTPPRGRPDTDNPPYKARRESSESLIQVRRLRRDNTMPHDKEHKRKGRRRKHHKCGQKKIKLYEHQNRSYWWLPSGCQVAPTAPRGQKQLCDGGHAGHYTPKKTRYGNIDTYGKLPPGLRSKPAPAVVTRRWSSVEIGAHQVILESTLPLNPAAPPTITPGSPVVDNFIPNILSKPYRSSTFTRGAIDHDHDQDIVHTVRKRLTHRKVPGEKLGTPESITLRRASGETAETHHSNETGEATPRARHNNAEQKRLSEAYLITAEDIDSITELIEANLRRNYDAHGRYDRQAGSTPGSQQATPSSSVTGTTLVPSKGYLTQPSVTVTEVQPVSARPRSPLNYLQFVPECKTKKDAIERTDSQKSVHKVIWESGGSPWSLSEVTDEDESKPSGHCGSEPSTPNKITLQIPQALRGDKGDAFDPHNASASINEWSWRCPQNEIAVVLTSSDSDSNDVLLEVSSDLRNPGAGPEIPPPKAAPRVRSRPPLRSAVSETKLQDVVSFPPLAPRKKTNDWYSPLPPMDMSPPLATSRSLYDIGIDVSFGPSSSKTVTPKSSQTSWVRSTQLSPSRSIEFDPNYEIRCKSPESYLEDPIRRKSVIKAHPNASARTSDLSTTGSSLGASSHERRKSSTPSVQRTLSPRVCESAAVRALISTSSGGRRSPPSRSHTSRPANNCTTRPTDRVDIERQNSPAPRARREASPLLSEIIPEGFSETSHPDEREPSSIPRLPRVRTIDNIHKGEHEVPPSKWRAPSPCPTPRSPSLSEDTSENESARGSLPGSLGPSTTTTTQVRRAWVDRLSLLKSKSPPLPTVDRVGIYGRMTGGQGALRGDPCGKVLRSEPHACDDCPKPSEPHVCDDCAKDPRVPSIDWIG